MRSPWDLTDSDNVIPRNLTPEVLQALRAVRFIAQHIKDADKDNEVGTPQLPCLLLLRTVRGKGEEEADSDCSGVFRMRISYRCYCLSSRFACFLLLFIARNWKRAEEKRKREGEVRESPKCATLNCKILNHNFIFYYASSLLKADDDDDDEANEILWLAIASNFFGHRNKAEADTECESTKRSSVCSSMFYDLCEMIFEFELYRLFPFYFSVLFCNLPNDFPFARADCWGLEVRLDGAGPLFPLAVHAVLCLWDLRHHLSVAVAIWHPRSNRSPAKRDSSAQKQFHAAPGHR